MFALHGAEQVEKPIPARRVMALAETERDRERALGWSGPLLCGSCLFSGLTSLSICCARHSALSPSPLQSSPFPSGGGKDGFLGKGPCPRADLARWLLSPWRDVPVARLSASLHAWDNSCSAGPGPKSCFGLDISSCRVSPTLHWLAKGSCHVELLGDWVLGLALSLLLVPLSADHCLLPPLLVSSHEETDPPLETRPHGTKSTRSLL